LLAASQDNLKSIDWEDIVSYGEKLDLSFNANVNSNLTVSKINN
jgi:hypothetical protein